MNDTTNFQLSGKVTVPGADGKEPRKGASVKVIHEGNDCRQTTTDDAGAYAFADLPAGSWRVEVTADGFGAQVRPRLELSADKDGLDFDLDKALTLSGTVMRYGKEARLSGAAVVVRKGTSRHVELTDEDGRYRFDQLAAGDWAVTVLEAESTPLQQTTALAESKPDCDFKLFRRAGTVDRDAGKVFYRFLVVALVLLVGGYLWAHLVLRDVPPSAVHAHLARAAAAVPSTAVELANVAERIADDPVRFRPAERKVLKGHLDKVQQAGGKADKRALATAIGEWRAWADETSETFLWEAAPLKYVEVACWALAGVLVHLILSVAGYLRFDRFYREGIVLHIANLVTTPIIVVAISILLGSLTVEIAFPNAETTPIDLSNLGLLVAVAFLLGLQPWAVVGYARAASRRVLGQERDAEASAG